MEPPIPDNIQQTEVDTNICGGCDDEVVLQDIHTDSCTWCDLSFHQSCLPEHEGNCEERQEDME